MKKKALLVIALFFVAMGLTATNDYFEDMIYIGEGIPCKAGGFVYYSVEELCSVIQRESGVITVSLVIARDNNDFILGEWIKYKLADRNLNTLAIHYADKSTASKAAISYDAMIEKIKKLADYNIPHYQMEVKLSDSMSIIYDESDFSAGSSSESPNICLNGEIVLKAIGWADTDKLIKALRGIR